MLIDQTREAVEEEDPKRTPQRLNQLAHQLTQARTFGEVKCADCEKEEVPLWLAFRCYYCGFIFCPACAPKHFGKTRDEYFADKGNTPK